MTLTKMNAHIEVKKGGRWLHYANPSIREGRNERMLYACINGTCGTDCMLKDYVHPLVARVRKENALPDDMSDVTRLCLSYDEQNRSPYNWGMLDSTGIRFLQKELIRIRGLLKGSWMYDDWCWDVEEFFHTRINGRPLAEHEGFEDSRIVFWFYEV